LLLVLFVTFSLPFPLTRHAARARCCASRSLRASCLMFGKWFTRCQTVKPSAAFASTGAFTDHDHSTFQAGVRPPGDGAAARAPTTSTPGGRTPVSTSVPSVPILLLLRLGFVRPAWEQWLVLWCVVVNDAKPRRTASRAAAAARRRQRVDAMSSGVTRSGTGTDRAHDIIPGLGGAKGAAKGGAAGGAAGEGGEGGSEAGPMPTPAPTPGPAAVLLLVGSGPRSPLVLTFAVAVAVAFAVVLLWLALSSSPTPHSRAASSGTTTTPPVTSSRTETSAEKFQSRRWPCGPAPMARARATTSSTSGCSPTDLQCRIRRRGLPARSTS
jgi:hypothetical protein